MRCARQNTTAPVGRVKGALDEQSIRLVGRIESPERVQRHRGASATATRWCAWARWPRSQDGFAELAGYSLRNGHPNVGITITRSRDASTVTVAEKVRKLVDEINTTLPEGTKLEVTQDGGKDAEQQPAQRDRGADLRRRSSRSSWCTPS